MAYPPDLPPSTRTDLTVAAGAHADDHNKAATALAAILEALGANPAGSYGDLTSRLADLDSATVAPKAIAQDVMGSDVSIGATATTLTGLNLTLTNPDTAAKWRVDLDALLRINAGAGGDGILVTVELLVDGVAQPGIIVAEIDPAASSSITAAGMHHRVWVLTGLAAGNRVLSVRATRGATGTATANADGTVLTAQAL